MLHTYVIRHTVSVILIHTVTDETRIEMRAEIMADRDGTRACGAGCREEGHWSLSLRRAKIFSLLS